MRAVLIWTGALLFFGLLNLAIVKKEAVMASGETIYLELAPLDPRSLMQGDYMVCAYEVARAVPAEELGLFGGRLVLRLDENRVGRYLRHDDGHPLGADERYLAYKNRGGARFGIENFFFQEGEGDRYQEARFARIRLGSGGQAILVDLVAEPAASPPEVLR